MIAGARKYVRRVCMLVPSLMSNKCSLRIPMAVSMKIQSTKPNTPLFVRLFSAQRSLNVCAIDSASCSLKVLG